MARLGVAGRGGSEDTLLYHRQDQGLGVGLGLGRRGSFGSSGQSMASPIHESRGISIRGVASRAEQVKNDAANTVRQPAKLSLVLK